MDVASLAQNLGVIILKSVLILAVAMLAHEFGHWLYAVRNFPGKTKVKWHSEKWKFGLRTIIYDVDLTNKQRLHFYGFGVFFGVVPIFFSMMANFGFTLLLMAYMMCCQNDIDKLKEIIKKDIEEEGWD